MDRRTFIGGLTITSAVFSTNSAFAAIIPAPTSGQGMVVIYRPRLARGGALRFPLTLNGMSLGNLTNGRVVAQPVQPGRYNVATSAPSVAGAVAVDVSVSEGQTVFVRASAMLGHPTWRPVLNVVTEQEGRSQVAAM